MPSSYEYGTFANYSPRGTSDLSKRSRNACGAIKAGRLDVIASAIPHLRRPNAEILAAFLAPDAVLVPVPRSAPLADGALWPSKVICEVLAGEGFGSEVLPLLRRTHAIPKSSQSPAAERPLVHDHLESMEVEHALLQPEKITIVDDVLTMGRTSFACAELVQEAYPDAEVRVFAMIRTQGLQDEIDAIVDPSIGIITGYASGKTHRDP